MARARIVGRSFARRPGPRPSRRCRSRSFATAARRVTEPPTVGANRAARRHAECSSSAAATGRRVAAEYLEDHGLRVLARGYRCRLGELDLVCRTAATSWSSRSARAAAARSASAVESIGPRKRAADRPGDAASTDATPRMAHRADSFRRGRVRRRSTRPSPRVALDPKRVRRQLKRYGVRGRVSREPVSAAERPWTNEYAGTFRRASRPSRPRSTLAPTIAAAAARR